MLGELAPALDHVTREIVACVDATRHATLSGTVYDQGLDVATARRRSGAADTRVATRSPSRQSQIGANSNLLEV